MAEAQARAVADAEAGWKRLSFAIATGVVEHLRRGDPDKTGYDTGYAETSTSATEDGQYWAWLSAFVEVFNTWSASETAGAAELKGALKGFFKDHPEAPSTLKGILQ